MNTYPILLFIGLFPFLFNCAPLLYLDRIFKKTDFDPDYSFGTSWREVAVYLHETADIIEQRILATYPNLTIEKGNLTDELVTISRYQSIPESLNRVLYQGDILLTTNQAKSIYEYAKDSFPEYSSDDPESGNYTQSRKRMKRKFDIQEQKWTFPIKYRISPGLGPGAIRSILEGVQYWETVSCLAFEQIQDIPQTPDNYIEFFRGGGCYSSIGMHGGRQVISIGYGCEQLSTVVHEIGHAIGMWHEQQRADSSQFININYRNVQANSLHNFEPSPPGTTDDLDVVYDFGSVMHYPSTAFSKDGRSVTISSKNKLYQGTFGDSEEASFYDVQLINKAYCSDKCKENTKCQNEGYPHPNHCSSVIQAHNRCLCPNGLGGLFCDENEPSLGGSNCGGVIELTDTEFTIESPNYPKIYRPDSKCSWLVKAPPGKRITIDFEMPFEFFCKQNQPCIDYVEVKTDSEKLGNTGPRFCCNPPNTVYSTGNKMLIIFRSRDPLLFLPYIQVTRGKGFKARLNLYPKEEESTPTTELTTTSILTTTTPETTTPQLSTTTARITTTSLLTTTIPETTTTQLSTTTAIGTTTEEDSEGQWTDWGAWGECSQSCGGCGTKSRTRNCWIGNCRGDDEDTTFCGTTACPTRTGYCTKILTKTRDQFGNFKYSYECKNAFKCCEGFKEISNKCVPIKENKSEESLKSDLSKEKSESQTKTEEAIRKELKELASQLLGR